MNFYNIIYNLETICNLKKGDKLIIRDNILIICPNTCLLYTSDAADEV